MYSLVSNYSQITGSWLVEEETEHATVPQASIASLGLAQGSSWICEFALYILLCQGKASISCMLLHFMHLGRYCGVCGGVGLMDIDCRGPTW